MTDQFAKTLVINDPNYAPGELVPQSGKSRATSTEVPESLTTNTSSTDETFEADDLSYEPPTFEDTSWLT